jgi:hypothetical protein
MSAGKAATRGLQRESHRQHCIIALRDKNAAHIQAHGSEFHSNGLFFYVAFPVLRVTLAYKNRHYSRFSVAQHA